MKNENTICVNFDLYRVLSLYYNRTLKPNLEQEYFFGPKIDGCRKDEIDTRLFDESKELFPCALIMTLILALCLFRFGILTFYAPIYQLRHGVLFLFKQNQILKII